MQTVLSASLLLSILHSPATAQQDMTSGLLAIGSKAPAFSVNSPRGGKISLASVIKGKKATLVNFWFYG